MLLIPTTVARLELTLKFCQFREKEYDHLFEFAENDDWFADEYPHKIFVGNDETRIGLVKKTVAYVVVDEGDDGSPVVQKWSIKNFREYE